MTASTEELLSYAKSQGFGDYSRASYETREEVADMVAEYTWEEERRHNAPDARAKRLADALRAAADAYRSGGASAEQIRLLFQRDCIDERGVRAYYKAKGWAYPKYGIRK